MSATFLKKISQFESSKKDFSTMFTGGFSCPPEPDQAGRVDNGSQLDQLDEDFDEAEDAGRAMQSDSHGLVGP